jgi:DNA-binding CsgD family transcriptional regulator
MSQIRVDQGDIARRRGDAIVARSSYEDALGLARNADDTWATAYILLQLGGLDRSTGNAALAIGSLTESMRLSTQVGDKALLHWAIFSRARTLLEAGDLVDARSEFRDGARVLVELRGNSRECILALAVASEWLAAAGRTAVAVESWAAAARGRLDQTRALPAYHRQEFERDYARARMALGPVRFHRHWVIGEARDAHDALERAIAEVDSVDLEDRPPVARPSIGRFDLTPREVEVIALVASGMSDGEIAESFVISKKTASTHVANIKSKLGARTRVEIAVMARNAGLD